MIEKYIFSDGNPGLIRQVGQFLEENLKFR